MDRRGRCVGYQEPQASSSPALHLGPLYMISQELKGLISRNGCKPLIQILSFLIWPFHILIWNDILIPFSGMSKRGKKIPLLLSELLIFSFQEDLGKAA